MSIEIKDLQTEIQKGFDALKAAGEKMETEIKLHGAASQETKNELAKINTTMDELKKRLDETETKMNRTGFAAGGAGQPDPEQEKKNAAFLQFIRKGMSNLTMEEKALVENVAGEILVTADIDQEIYRALPKLTLFRNLAGNRKTGSDRVRRRSLTDLTVGWGKIEVTSPTTKLGNFNSDTTPSEAYIYVEDAYGLTKIGEDELEDADMNLQAILVDAFSNAYAALEESGFIKGTGHANNQPEGIRNGAVVTRFQSATAAAFVVDDLIKLYYAVPAQYRKNGTFLVHSIIEQTARLAKDSQGQYLWQPSLQAGSPNMFNGKPIYAQDDFDNTIATTKEVGAFGDFKMGYQIVDNTGASGVTRLNELYAEDGLIGFKFKRRVGGGVVRPDAMRILKIT